MLSKAVVSMVALVSVGIAALASTTATAAPTPASAHRATTSRVHAKPKPPTRAAVVAPRPKKDAPAPATKGEKSGVDAHDVPKQSLTPLPTIAATIGTPLVMPVSTSASSTHASDAKVHSPEPRRTPVFNGTGAHKPLLISTRTTHKSAENKPPCLRDATIVMRGTEEEKIALTKCDGSAAPLAVEEMSILARPGSAAKPAKTIDALAKSKGTEVAPGIRRIDARLVERLQNVVDHFAKTGATSKVFVVSGYRPTSAGSFHATGRALDFRIEGVKNEELVAYCKTLPDTGCGYYPNSSFIHLDVRESGAGHVSWIDSSGPGESPKYVASWPPPQSEESDPSHLLAKLGTELELLPPSGDHDAKADTGSKSDLEAKLEKSDEDPPAAVATKELNVEITP